MTRFLTWNIGSFIFLKFGKYIGLQSRDEHEYFQPKRNGAYASDVIKNIDPDFLYLQEFYLPEDARAIERLEAYPYRLFLDQWYRKNGALLASKKPFTRIDAGGIPIVHYEHLSIFPIHFNSFSPSTRLTEAMAINRIAEGRQNTVVLGDTNLWSRGNTFLFPQDREAYSQLDTAFRDASKDCVSTSFFGFGLDKIFVSKDLVTSTVSSPGLRGEWMDHYPVFADIINRKET